tara:strand:- start:215 stop:1327 length:1113 start_codon:yes stop_codon:yes gene_type:complete
MALSKVDLANMVENVAPENTIPDVSFRNLVINGDMSIAQRGTSFTSASGYTLDRYTWTDDSTSAFTITQSTDVPSGQGFATSMKFDCTTANTSLGSSDQIRQVQKIEAQNLQHLRYGTSSAKSVTLSFWVKSNKTGTYCATLSQEDDSYASFTKEYTISSSDTWEKKTLTFDGDTGGVINNDNGAGLWLMFAFGAGSGRHMTANQWNSSYGLSTSNQVNLADNTSNELYLTGVQLEVGTSASDFEFLPVDVNLARCQRYFFVIDESTQGNYDFAVGHARRNSGGYIVFSLPVTMRTAPTGVTVSNVGQFQIVTYGIVNAALSSLTFNNAGPNFIKLDANTGSTSFTTGYGINIYSVGSGNGKIEITGAEL